MILHCTQHVLFGAAAAIAAWSWACSDEARFVTPPEESEDELRPDGDDEDSEGDEPSGAGGSGDPGMGGGTSSNGGSQDDTDDDEPEGETLPEPIPFTSPRGACTQSSRVGGFSVERQVDFGVVEGEVREGVVPTAISNVVADDGRCQLLERRNLACFPACVGVETCGETGACIPFPRGLSVGQVSISGLTKETVMQPLSPGNRYFSPGADNPPFPVATQIVLSAAGDEGLPGFQLFGMGSEPLPEAPSWVLAAGSDLVVEWAAPTADVETTVLIELTIDQHGLTPLSLSCELEDTGSATIPASTVDRLIASGVTGFPNGRIMRRTADHVDLAIGCVDLLVGSRFAASVSVAGFTPCNDPGDCPTGLTCNIALERCE